MSRHSPLTQVQERAWPVCLPRVESNGVVCLLWLQGKRHFECVTYCFILEHTQNAY